MPVVEVKRLRWHRGARLHHIAKTTGGRVDLSRYAFSGNANKENAMPRMTEEELCFTRVLVYFDDSPEAQQALVEAIDLAAYFRGELTILTAIVAPTLVMIGEAAVWTGLPADHEEIAMITQSRAVAQVPSNVALRTILTPDPIRPVLLKHVNSGAFDLLVIGARPRRIARPFAVSGGVGRCVTQRSAVPVLAAYAPGLGRRRSSGLPQRWRILFSYVARSQRPAL